MDAFTSVHQLFSVDFNKILMNERRLSMKRCFNVMVSFLLFFCLVSCTGSSAQWKRDDVSSINKNKVKSEAKVVELLGKPVQKYNSNGQQVWEYRKPADDKVGLNTFVAIGSFGFLSGVDSAYVDLIRFYFIDGKVVDVRYEENVASVGGFFLQR